MTTSPRMNASIMTPVLVAGCIILMLSFAVRASFGVFQIPVGSEFGWPRAEFSLAIAIQNLAWGIGQPMFGAMAERFGDRKAIVTGAFLYALGLVLSSYAITPGQHQLLNILIGFGIAGTGFGVVLAVVGRATSAENRSMSLGIATAAGSAGQVFGYFIYNDGAAEVYVKNFNATAANVTVGSTTPVMTIPIPAGGASNVEFGNGIAFSTAICAAATTVVGDADATAPAANQCVANFFYK